ncbi:hypothetical protein HID58_048245 [Brassica napus]|uniref:Ankyrin repeat family protein n=2 Tax=Brassica TaxID=3705 RepID=A0ABQ8B1M6_BRANA|nr:hypothetical protein HID58_048245 [Brassica napus]
MSIVVDFNRVSNIVAQAENMNERSSTSIQDENIYEKLKVAAQDGNIERLYGLIAVDPNVLGHSDKVPFCETPLNIAIEAGQTHFSMELMILKPSLSSKLNVSGFSQMHLALQNNYSRMVRGFIAIINSLVRIKGRGRVTPLHHVARIGDAELLSEFLFSCPSIEDLTIKCETPVHVAVENHQWMTFKVLLGWLKRVMKLLHKTVKVNAKNFCGKTAMDILQTYQSPCYPEARDFFQTRKKD